MKPKELVLSQKLSSSEVEYFEGFTKRWEDFSNTVGCMSKEEVLKVLKYIITHRPASNSLGKRAVQRFNALNKLKWGDLTNDTLRQESDLERVKEA